MQYGWEVEDAGGGAAGSKGGKAAAGGGGGFRRFTRMHTHWWGGTSGFNPVLLHTCKQHLRPTPPPAHTLLRTPSHLSAWHTPQHYSSPSQSPPPPIGSPLA